METVCVRPLLEIRLDRRSPSGERLREPASTPCRSRVVDNVDDQLSPITAWLRSVADDIGDTRASGLGCCELSNPDDPRISRAGVGRDTDRFDGKLGRIRVPPLSAGPRETDLRASRCYGARR